MPMINEPTIGEPIAYRGPLAEEFQETPYGGVQPESFAAASEAVEEPSYWEVFKSGIARGVDQLEASAAGAIALAGDIVGSDLIRDYGYDQYVKQMEEAGLNPPSVESIYDIEDVDSFLDWLAGTAGSVIPSAIGAVASGGVGSAVGGQVGRLGMQAASKAALKSTLRASLQRQFNQGKRGKAALAGVLEEFGQSTTGKVTRQKLKDAVKQSAKNERDAYVRHAAKRGAQAGVAGFSSTVESGSNWVDDYETNGDNTNPLGDLAFGVASGMTDLIGAEGMLITKLFGTDAGIKLARQVGREHAKKLERGAARTAVEELTSSMAGEATQEATQELMSTMNSYFNTHSIDAIMTEDVAKRLVDAAAAGAIGGAMFGAPSAISSSFSARAHAQEVQRAKIAEEQAKLEDSPVIKRKERLGLELEQHYSHLHNLGLQIAETEKMASAQSLTSAGDQTRAWGQLAVLKNQWKETAKLIQKGREQFNAADLDAKAEVQSIQRRIDTTLKQQQEVSGLKAGAWASITKEVENARIILGNHIEKLREQGAPAEEIAKHEDTWREIEALGTETVEGIETKIPAGESYRIKSYTQKQLAKMSQKLASVRTTFKKAEQKYADMTPEEARNAERKSAEGRAFYRSVQKNAQLMQADTDADLAARKKQRVENQAALDAAITDYNATGAAVNDMWNQMGRPHPTVQGDPSIFGTTALQEEAVQAMNAPRTDLTNQPDIAYKPGDLTKQEEDINKQQQAFEADRRETVFKMLEAKARKQKKKLPKREAIEKLPMQVINTHYDNGKSGSYGPDAKKLAEETFGKIYKDDAPVDRAYNNAFSAIFKDNTLKGAKTMQAVSRALAKKMSGKGMPYTYNEALSVMNALLPNALNMRPTVGAKWLRDSLFVTPYLVDDTGRVQEAVGIDPVTGAELEGGTDRGSYLRKEGKIIISMLTASDKSTFLHETAHAYLDNLTERVNNGWATERDHKDFALVKEWLDWKDSQVGFTRAQHEQFAKGFEKYLMTGKAPSKGLAKFFELVKKWLNKIYHSADALNVDLSPAAKRIYTNMLLPEAERKHVAAPKKAKKNPKVKILGTPRKQSAVKAEAVKKLAETKRGAKRAMSEDTRSYTTPDGKIDYTWLDIAKEKLQDYYHPIRMLVQAVKEKGGTVTTETNVWAIEEGIPNLLVDKLKRFDRKFVQPMLEDIKAYAKEVGDADTVQKNIDLYLQAKHTEERNAAIIKRRKTNKDDPAPSGMSNEKAQKILDGETNVLVTPTLERIQKQVMKINNYQLKIIRENNLLPKSQIEALENAYENYVPLKGWANLMEETDPNYKTRMRGAELKLKRILGRSEGSGPASPLVHSILQTMDVLSVQTRAAAGRGLLQLIEENKHLEGEDFFFELGTKEKIKSRWEYNSKGELVYTQEPLPFTGEDNVVTVIDNDGNRVRLLAKDERVARAFTGLNLAQTHPIIQFIGKITRAMAKLATTWNPAFVLTNPVRDVTTALINITDEKMQRVDKKFDLSNEKVRRQLTSNFYPAQKAIRQWLKGKSMSSVQDKDFQTALIAFRAYGGFSEQYSLNDYQSIADGIEAAVKDSMKKGDVFSYSKSLSMKALDALDMQSNILENMTRLSTFKTLSDAWMAKGMPKEEAYQRAASASRNITVNFSRRGAWAPILSPLFMFSNASIQGTARMFKTILRNRKLAAGMMSGAVAGAMILAQVGRAIGGEDDDGVSYYDKIPDWVKNNNLILMIPGTNGKYAKIPLPYGYNIFNVMGQMFDQMVSGRRDVLSAASEVVNSAFDNFSPVGSPEAGWTTLLPTILRPPFQLEANTGFFGQKIMPENPSWIKHDQPDSERYWSTVNPALRWVTTMLNEYSGGSPYKKGIIDVSPETIEHFIEAYTGGLGKLFSRSVGVAADIWSAATTDGKDLSVAETMAEVPVVRRFFGATNFFSTLHEFNNTRAEIAGLEAQYKYIKGQGKEARSEFLKDNPKFMAKVNVAKAADKRLRKLRKLKNSILRSARVERETARLEKIRKMEQTIIKDMIRRVKKLGG